jgi:hypothetical protein
MTRTNLQQLIIQVKMCLLCGLWILFIFREKKDNDEGNVLTFNGPSTTPPNVMLLIWVAAICL